MLKQQKRHETRSIDVAPMQGLIHTDIGILILGRSTLGPQIRKSQPTNQSLKPGLNLFRGFTKPAKSPVPKETKQSCLATPAEIIFLD